MNVDNLTELVGGSTLYCVLDGTGGYSQMPLAEESCDCTAIETDLGLMRSTVVVQGGTNSVPQYQRQMERMFSPLIPSVVIPYLDDLIIRNGLKTLSPRVDGIREEIITFMSKLREIFDIARSYCYTFSPQKMKLAISQVDVLGFNCSVHGRTIAKKHTAVIQNWDIPKNADEVRSFVQLCNFFRVLVPHFATLTAPLYALLKKDVELAWGWTEQNVFELLKVKLTTYPIVQAPDFSRKFIINCDAGPNAGGGYLAQENEDGTGVITRYFSFKIDDREKKYSQVKRELLVIMEMLKRLKDYIYGVEFIVETDCKPAIQMIQKLDLIDPTLTRWVTFISLFFPVLVHVPGRDMVVSDAMSRNERLELYDDIEVEREVDYYLRNVGDIQDDEFYQEEYYDEEHIRIGLYLVAQMIPADVNRRDFVKRALSFALKNGELYKKTKKSFRYAEESYLW